MALNAQVPLWSTQLNIIGDCRVLTAPLFPEVAWMAAPPESLARQLAVASRNTWNRPGKHLPWLNIAPVLDLHTESLAMELHPPRGSTLPTPLILRFDVLLGEAPSGHWQGFVPAMAIGAAAPNADALRESLREAIRLECVRERRLLDASRVLSVQWYASVELHRTDVDVAFYTFSEQREFREAKKRALLPEIATRLRPGRERIFGVERALEELTHAVHSPDNRSILLVGASGLGKTALVEAFAFRNRLVSGEPLWETTAAQMERVLTDQNGWQDNLSKTVRELKERNAWLYLRNFAELFEVGRYSGNNVSMGEYLRPRLSTGEIGIVSECTPAQVARLEARYPGCLDSFRRITLEEPAPAALADICLKRARVDAKGAVVKRAAIETLLRIQKRFAPYSGFPGKPIRFLESLSISHRGGTVPIDRDVVFQRFCAETGMPRALIDPQADLPTERIESHFQERIFGQPGAIAAIVSALVSVRAGLSRPKRPIATLLFVGPTGVGKTETAKALASFMFGSQDRMLRLDMSEYATADAAIRLTEGPGGDGRLTGAIRREPFSVVLLDEIEKAHPMVFDLLLQVLGEGRLSDGNGHLADFCSSIIILTSNIGAAEARTAPSGFRPGGSRSRDLLETYTAAAERHFRPEFFNRLDRVVAFAPLGEGAIERVLTRELRALEGRPGIRLRRASLTLSDAAQSHLAREGYDPAWGARHLQRVLRSQVSAPIAVALNQSTTPRPVQLFIDHIGGRLSCDLTEQEPDKDRLSALVRFNLVADEIDAVRRVARQIADGSRYASLVSELQYLSRREKRLGKRFWQDTEKAARFGLLQQVAQDCREMFALIRDLSTETVLAAIEDDILPEAFEESLAEYRLQERTAQRALFNALATDGTEVTLGVYGDPEQGRPLLELYAGVAAELELELRQRTLWLRRPPSERGIPERLPDNKAEREAVIADRDQLYATLPLDAEPTPDCAQIIGFELEVTGAGSAALLGPEAGLFKWEEGSEPTKLLLATAPCGWSVFDHTDERPADVHRRKPYQGPPRRFIGRGRVHDKVLRETLEGSLEDFIRGRLLASFASTLVEDLTS